MSEKITITKTELNKILAVIKQMKELFLKKEKK
jgi:hypothetical protein